MASRDELIRELSRDLRPAPRLRDPLQLTLIWWVGAFLFVVLATLAVEPMRLGFASQLLASPRFAGETLFGLAAGLIAIRIAFSLGIPGLRSPLRRIGLALGLLALWSSAYVYGLIDPALEPSMLGKRRLCFVEVWLHGVPILLAALLLLRRLAPLKRVRAGLVAGAAAGAIPALFMQLACMYIPSHILIFHIAPGALLLLVGAVAGRLLLRRI
jgi:hypothetical protein